LLLLWLLVVFVVVRGVVVIAVVVFAVVVHVVVVVVVVDVFVVDGVGVGVAVVVNGGAGVGVGAGSGAGAGVDFETDFAEYQRKTDMLDNYYDEIELAINAIDLKLTTAKTKKEYNDLTTSKEALVLRRKQILKELNDLVDEFDTRFPAVTKTPTSRTPARKLRDEFI